MIKLIVQHSSKLIEFLVLLQLNLTKPQTRHVLRIVDAVIVSEAPYKTLATLYDIIVDAPDASNGADFLRLSPWQVAEDLRGQQQAFVIGELKRLMDESGERVLYVSIDDSLTAKDKGTRHLQPVDFHHDHTKSSGRKQAYSNGTVHVEVRLQLGEHVYVFDWALYLREKTVRRLNQKRAKPRRLRFRSKYNLVRVILMELKAERCKTSYEPIDPAFGLTLSTPAFCPLRPTETSINPSQKQSFCAMTSAFWRDILGATQTHKGSPS